ncbi:hypothetical protein GH714_031760 [Hevea brasiliensis]|uniref:Adenylyl-sulfate kinase n=1 Tax=Hevea brasiliensis TaxID=3981 RepID=A0A6A6N8L1_HEVBR|nr:hypothetical protein GH714_031760 [Hevea brasiliensis]
MNAVGIKPLPGFATLRDGYLPGNAKARSVLRITAADGLQQAVRVDVNGNGKAKLDTLKPNGSPLGSILANGFTSNGKSTVACHLSKILTQMGKLTYILDGDNLRHGLNSDLSFKAEDRAENIRRVGEVAKLFSDAGVICIACLISPYRRDREACRKILPNGDFIEVFMDVPLGVCESRDPKGLYKLARAGKIKGFTGIDDPYEPPVNCEITLKCDNGIYASPSAMAEKVICYLEYNGYLQA